MIERLVAGLRVRHVERLASRPPTRPSPDPIAVQLRPQQLDRRERLRRLGARIQRHGDLREVVGRLADHGGIDALQLGEFTGRLFGLVHGHDDDRGRGGAGRERIGQDFLTLHRLGLLAGTGRSATVRSGRRSSPLASTPSTMKPPWRRSRAAARRRGRACPRRCARWRRASRSAERRARTGLGRTARGRPAARGGRRSSRPRCRPRRRDRARGCRRVRRTAASAGRGRRSSRSR